MMAGMFTNGMMTGTRLAGMNVGNKTNDHSASSLSLGCFDLGATSSPKRFGWVKMNLDTRAAVRRCPLNCGPDGARDGSFHRTASGECILEGGARQFQGDDENGLCRSLHGSLTGEHKSLVQCG